MPQYHRLKPKYFFLQSHNLPIFSEKYARPGRGIQGTPILFSKSIQGMKSYRQREVSKPNLGDLSNSIFKEFFWKSFPMVGCVVSANSVLFFPSLSTPSRSFGLIICSQRGQSSLGPALCFSECSRQDWKERGVFLQALPSFHTMSLQSRKPPAFGVRRPDKPQPVTSHVNLHFLIYKLEIIRSALSTTLWHCYKFKVRGIKAFLNKHMVIVLKK